jgi:Squalene-hopene cyclase C-terminal domain
MMIDGRPRDRRTSFFERLPFPPFPSVPLAMFFLVTFSALFLPYRISCQPAFSATPDSPEVRGMIERAKGFLATAKDERLGAAPLVGLVFVKEQEATHSQVAAAVQVCDKIARMSLEEVRAINEIYSLGLAIVFLCEYDPKGQQATIERLLKHLYALQKEQGAWGYSEGFNAAFCDTSMSQYAILAMWTASKAGYKVPRARVRRAVQWLLSTQDPSGGWGYQGLIAPDFTKERVAQNGVSVSMTSAGLGSMYVCGELLGLRAKATEAEKRGLDVPEVFIPVIDPAEAEAMTITTPKLRGMIEKSTEDGRAWLEKNYVVDSGQWRMYYLYALERCRSFEELHLGVKDQKAVWYDQGVAYLESLQSAEGNFTAQTEMDVPATAFAALFLMRGTQRSIRASETSEGLASGGRGLPRDLRNARISGHRVVSPLLTASAKDVLEMLDKSSEELDYLDDETANIVLSKDPRTRLDQVERFRRLVREGNPTQSRAAIVGLMGSRDMDNAPFFIEALSSPDPSVVQAARSALRELSRKVDDLGPRAGCSDEELRQAIKAWQDWYDHFKGLEASR